MSIYYAHPMALYGSDMEQADVARIEAALGPCTNPNTPPFQGAVEATKRVGGAPMQPFLEAVWASDGLAWRAFPDGTVGAGVVVEIDTALHAGKPVYRLPDLVEVVPDPGLVLSIADTRAANARWAPTDWI